MARRQQTGFTRKDKSWSLLAGGQATPSADGTTLLGSSLLALEALTVMRFLGEYAIAPSATPVAGDGVRLTIGIGVFSADAVAAGVASLPDPEDEPDFPWIYWMGHSIIFATADPDPSNLGASLRHSFDIRFMRKLKPRQSVQAVVQYANVSGNPAMRIGLGGVRVLVAE